MEKEQFLKIYSKMSSEDLAELLWDMVSSLEFTMPVPKTDISQKDKPTEPVSPYRITCGNKNANTRYKSKTISDTITF